MAVILALMMGYWLFDKITAISPNKAQKVAVNVVQEYSRSGFIKHKDLYLAEARTDGYPFVYIFRSRSKPSYDFWVMVHSRGQVESSGGYE